MDKRIRARSGRLVRICSCVNGCASFPASFLGAYLIWMSGAQDFAEGRDKQAAQKCMCMDTGLGRWRVWDGSGGQQLLCSAKGCLQALGGFYTTHGLLKMLAKCVAVYSTGSLWAALSGPYAFLLASL